MGGGGTPCSPPKIRWVLDILRMRRGRVLFRQLSCWSFGFLGVGGKEEGKLPDPGRLGGGTPWVPPKYADL